MMKKKVELDLSNDVTKSEVRKAKGIDASEFAKKVHLVRIKSKVNNLDVDKSRTVPTNLTKLSNFVDNDFAEKADYNKKKKYIKRKLPSQDKPVTTDKC